MSTQSGPACGSKTEPYLSSLTQSFFPQYFICMRFFLSYCVLLQPTYNRNNSAWARLWHRGPFFARFPARRSAFAKICPRPHDGCPSEIFSQRVIFCRVLAVRVFCVAGCAVSQREQEVNKHILMASFGRMFVQLATLALDCAVSKRTHERAEV